MYNLTGPASAVSHFPKRSNVVRKVNYPTGNPLLLTFDLCGAMWGFTWGPFGVLCGVHVGLCGVGRDFCKIIENSEGAIAHFGDRNFIAAVRRGQRRERNRRPLPHFAREIMAESQSIEAPDILRRRQRMIPKGR